MRRALQLAALGAGNVSPNPMVGAVIVSPDGRIIGEGYHRRFGGPHAEVNAVASVKDSDLQLLPSSTIYVTLEPCSHWGKTPPCSLLLIEKGIGRIVVGATDPFREVSGRGIRMLRDAGREVVTGCLEEECKRLNRRFFTAHITGRPWIQLKWAESADGYMAAASSENPIPVKFSIPLTSMLMHRERGMADAIMVGVNTVIIDNPSLTTRLWPGKSPRRVTFKSDRIPDDLAINGEDTIFLPSEKNLADNMATLYKDFSVTSVMVEGGKALLESFIRSGLYDEIRVETASVNIGGGLPSPTLLHIPLVEENIIDGNMIRVYRPSDAL